MSFACVSASHWFVSNERSSLAKKKRRPTPHAADSGFAASSQAWLASKGTITHASLARATAAGYANRWAFGEQQYL